MSSGVLSVYRKYHVINIPQVVVDYRNKSQRTCLCLSLNDSLCLDEGWNSTRGGRPACVHKMDAKQLSYSGPT